MSQTTKNMDTVLDKTLNIDLRDFKGKSAEEIEAFFDDYSAQHIRLQGKEWSAQEIHDFKVRVKEEYKAIREQLQDERKRLREMERSGDEGTRPGLSSSHALEEIDSLLDTLRTTEKEFNKVTLEDVRNADKTIQDLSDGSNANINKLTLDGETYTFRLGGKITPDQALEQAAIPGENSTDTSALEDGEAKTPVTNAQGEVIKDVDGNGFINYQDYLASTRKNPLDAQSVFINTPGQSWKLIASDPTTGNLTFKVVDQEGNFCNVNFTNCEKTNFFNQSGLKVDDTFSSELSKRLYFDNKPESLFEKNNNLQNKTSARLKYLKGYTSATSSATLNEINNTFGIGADSVKVKAGLDKLFGYVDNPYQDVNLVWDDIIKTSDKNTLLAITAAMAFYTGDGGAGYLEKVISMGTAKIQSALGPIEKYSENDILLNILLENHGGAGQFGGTNIWAVGFASGAGAPYKAGLLTNHAKNQKAIQKYQQLALKAGLPLSGSELAALQAEKGPFESTQPDPNLLLPSTPADVNPYSWGDAGKDVGFSAAAGATGGAIIGTMIAPGAGTLIGAGIGAGAGAIVGGIKAVGSWLGAW